MDDEDAAGLDALQHLTGTEFESGDVHERRGRNEPAPGVEAEDGREEWSGGRQNYANESVGATTEACGHPSVEAGATSGAWQGHAHHFVKSENAIEDKRWVGFDITEVKSNSSMVYICVACGGLSLCLLRHRSLHIRSMPVSQDEQRRMCRLLIAHKQPSGRTCLFLLLR
jgi:hypothetical protein